MSNGGVCTTLFVKTVKAASVPICSKRTYPLNDSACLHNPHGRHEHLGNNKTHFIKPVLQRSSILMQVQSRPRALNKEAKADREGEREEEEEARCRVHAALDRKSTSGRGSEPRQSWGSLKSECPYMTQPKFELELSKNKLDKRYRSRAKGNGSRSGRGRAAFGASV